MRQKLVHGGIFLAVVLPVIIIGAYSYVKISRDLTESALSRRQTIAHLAAVTLKEKLDRAKDLAISLATRVAFRRLVADGRWDEAIQIMQTVPADFPFIDRIFIADPAGTLMADIPPLPGVRGKNFVFRDWYRGVSREWSPYVSEVYTRAAEPRLNVIAVAAPIRSDDQTVTGILVLQARLDTLLEWVQAVDVGPSGFVYVVDNKGSLAAHPKFPLQGKIIDFSGVPAVREALRGEQGVTMGFNPIEQEERLSAYKPVPGYGWVVVAQQPVGAAFASRSENLRTLLVFYGAILAVNCLLAVIIIRTIAALRRANGEAARLNAKLEAANKELEAFSYSVSHDLRAPLRAIDGFSRALEQDYGGSLDGTAKDYLARILNGCARMAELIDDLLELSRVSRREMTRQPVDLSAVARAIADELQQTDVRRRAAFHIAPGVAAVGDAKLLRIALQNLLGNAWKFTQKRDGAAIAFEVVTHEGETAYAVRDNGAGFDMTYAGKLFGVFQRLHHASEFPGTGIGLATVQRIIHRHGGRVWAEGRVNEGAAFYFTLPRDGLS
ncbi:MAG: cache domain-containing protein [Nitrospirota bacterium]